MSGAVAAAGRCVRDSFGRACFSRAFVAGCIATSAFLPGTSTAWASTPPVIDAFVTSAPSVAPGAVLTVSVQAHDPDCASGTCTSGCGQYLRADLTAWSAAVGSFVAKNNGTSSSPYAASAEWQAPAVEGTYKVSVTVSDSGTFLCGSRASVSASVDVRVTTSTNRPPLVGSVTAAPGQLLPAQKAALSCSASDPDGDALTYAWTTDAGTVTGSGASATFTAGQPAVATVTCTATDAQGATASGVVRVSVTDALAESRLTQHLAAPQRIAVDSMGDVYVADAGNGGIAVLNLADGQLVYRLAFAGITSVAVDWQDRLLAGSTSGAWLLDRSGRRLLVLDPGEPLGPVADTAVDTPRRRYAVLYGGASRILVYDETGARIGAVGVAGDEAGQLRRPQGVAFTPQGDLVVADSGHATVRVLGLDGALRASFGGNGTSAGRFVRLDDVEVDADGVIYASDSYQSWVQAFNPDGSLREVIGTYGDGLGRFRTPCGIAAIPGLRKLVVASLNTPSLEVFRTKGDPVSALVPRAAVSQAALAFAATPVGARSATAQVTLTNSGSAPLGIRKVVVNGEFTQSNDCPLALDPGRACAFALAYVPETPGVASGSLVVETSATPANVTVALSGHAFLTAAASLAPDRLQFAEQRVGTTSGAQRLTLTSSGGAALSIFRIGVSAGFGVASTCAAELPAGQACLIEVAFTPHSAGPVSGVLTVESNAANGPATAALSGAGIAAVLDAQPKALDFGTRRLRTGGRPDTVTITAVGAQPVTIGSLSVLGPSAAFTVRADRCSGRTLALGSSCSVRVSFRPEDAGSHEAVLHAVTVEGEALDLVSLTGTGQPRDEREVVFRDDFESGRLAAWTEFVPGEARLEIGAERPERFDLGWAALGDRRTVVVRVLNRLDRPVALESVELTGAEEKAFELVADGCTATRLAAGGSCALELAFSPLAPGVAAAQIEVSSSAGRDVLKIEGEGAVTSDGPR